MRSFSSVALLAVAVAIVAILSVQGADAHYIRYYYDNTGCGGSQTRLWFLGTSTSCQENWNSTSTKAITGSFKLTKCNATEGQYIWEGYSTRTCTGTSVDFSGTAENCQSLAELGGTYAGSMRVYCSAGSVAAAAVAVVAAIIALLL